MSRAAVTKSRADKTKGGTSAPTPAVLHEIVPGRYNDQDWGFMLDKDDGDEFITDIVEDICSNAVSIIYDKYIERQLLPFTILQAKDAILQIIEWQFLMQDEGEPTIEDDETWVEDEEPIPAIADCWAQGLVPKRYVAGLTPEPITEEPTELEVEEIDMTDEVAPTPEAADEEEEEEIKVEEPESLQPEETESPPEDTKEPEPERKPEPPKEQPKKKRKKFRPYGGRINHAGLGGMVESLEQTEMRLLQEEASNYKIAGEDQNSNNTLMNMPASCHSILRVQAGRPPGNKDVIYDDQGNVLSVTKLDPSKLPSHFVRTTFSVVDPAVEAAQARLEAMRTGRFVPASQKKKKNKFMTAMFAAAESKVDTKVKDIKPQDAVQSLPAPLIECMDIAPGVVVKEGNRIKRGPRQFGKTTETEVNANLRPLLPHPPTPVYTARDILDCGTPVLKMIRDSPIIPPIAHKQASY
ncbi:uncharacterized protein C2orf81 homolog isoform X2 [Lineus longissimus]|uniref:uncharacterized protein C2orf81 homolog isoform X2 n=1 Tax=Lineus longissimus TaxID=88925 RepID=UPI00315DB881